ncbi:MerR family transcriptional regulator [Streptomyces sp. ventii]|uniref:MerR family transcriptional regulator n=1 Tax=Streptomyces spiramenti TaxID=2720606 RepID=A0ABX1AKY4_9ACTN|nr:MerR family transcriptional regulator [Streptomyces spiramenti]
MAWSTRELAGLADTTVKAIRHYHAIGLLEEPERALNGYKRYGTPHLVRLLQIRRLRELGMSLEAIAGVSGPDDGFADAVRALDADLAAAIERQQAVRAELADLLRHEATADVPAGFEAVASNLSDADRATITVSSQLFSETVAREIRGMAAIRHELDSEFDDLPPDADERTVADLARRLAPLVRDLHERFPSSRDPAAHARGERRAAIATMAQTLADHYNPAQVAVLRELGRLLAAERTAEPPPAE